MSELAAAGAAFISTFPSEIDEKFDQDQDLIEENQSQDSSTKSHLAVPENDSISSSDEDDEDLDSDFTEENLDNAKNDINKTKTLPPRSNLMQNGISSLKRSFTLPRNPLINLTNSSVVGVKKAKKSVSVMKDTTAENCTSATSSPAKPVSNR